MFVRAITETIDLPCKMVEKPDPTLPAGERVVEREGVPGKRLKVFRVLVVKGEEGSRVLKADKVTVRPVDGLVRVGTKVAVKAVPVSSKAAPPVSGRKLRVESTAYAPNHGVGVGSTTATGAKAGYGVVAVDPRVIPLGSRLYIPVYGYGVAAETGGAIQGARVDVCFDTVAECLSWGRRTVTITILD